MKTGIVKSKAGHYTAWAKADGCADADATVPLLGITEARQHVAAMRTACEGLAGMAVRIRLAQYQRDRA